MKLNRIHLSKLVSLSETNQNLFRNTLIATSSTRTSTSNYFNSKAMTNTRELSTRHASTKAYSSLGTSGSISTVINNRFQNGKCFSSPILTSSYSTYSSSSLCHYVNNKLNYSSSLQKLNYLVQFNSHLSSSSNILLIPNNELSKILTKAEKCVGYPTSFLNLRYLVSDEVAHFANLVRKLMQTKHPLIKMARRLFMPSTDQNSVKRSWQINGLIVLLISKAAGIPLTNTHFLESEISDGIHQSQRCLAEISEMIHMGSLIHKGVIDLKHVIGIGQNKEKNEEKSSQYQQDMEQGNKLAVLCGDYLIASACNNLAKLHNTEVVDIMSKVIADISQGAFEQESKSTKHTFLSLWYDRLNSNSSSLMANSAKSALMLVKHSKQLQELAYTFAKHLDIAYKIWLELYEFKNDTNYIHKANSLLNAILLDATSKDTTSNQLERKATKDEEASVLAETKKLFHKHFSQAMQSLSSLENERSEHDAISSLRSILDLMKSTI